MRTDSLLTVGGGSRRARDVVACPLAAWLNAKGAQTARGRAFGKDTVREMLVNAVYCGYVCGLRSKDRFVRGLHEPLVAEELFNRVQEIRAWRTHASSNHECGA